MVLTNLNNRPSPTAILDGGGIAPLEMHGHVEFSTIEEAKMDIHEDQLSTKVGACPPSSRVEANR